MKVLKAVAFIAAVAAVVAVSGGSAAATTLCKENVNPCPAGQEYPEKETILAGLPAGTGLNYAASTGAITRFTGFCQESSISWSTTENRGAGKVLFGNVSTLLYGKCKNGMSPCEKVTAQNLPYNAELLPTVMGKGRALLVNGESGARKFKFEKCGMFSVNCTYEPGEIGLDVNGGSPATISILWEIKSEGGNPLCGEKITMSTTYSVAVPKPLWVQSSP